MYEYQEMMIEELEGLENQNASRWPGRLLVAALILSALACLTALWFSGTLLSAPEHMMPDAWLQFIADHRLLVLLVPAMCLAVCYITLRSLTREIMAVPERYLDERQHMLRDQAHRSAFKIIKLACALIPACFLFSRLPWFNSAPTVSSLYTEIIYPGAYTFHQSPQYVSSLGTGNTYLFFFPFKATVVPASSIEIALAGGLLLLGLLLVVSALPMCVLAWKGKR